MSEEIDVKKKQKNYTTTYKIRFYTNNLEYLQLTQNLYNELIKKYYDLIFKYENLLNLSNQKCLRELEKLTVVGLSGEKPVEFFEQNAPMEFRRAAINQAIGLAKSYFELIKRFQNDKRAQLPSKASTFNCSVTFYKGMYKNLTREGKVKIKLFDGENWKWFDAKFKNWNFKEEDQILSPTIVIHRDYVMAHVPIKRKIDDIVKIKERVKDPNLKICGLAFSNTNKLVTCAVVNNKGELIKTLFVPGGNEYKNQINQILNRQRKNIDKNKKILQVQQSYKKYREKMNRVVNHYAHIISRRIVDFCKENNVGILVTALSTKDKAYYFIKGQKNRPIYLREKISTYLNYKAFREGILSTVVMRKDKASKCYKCGGEIKSRKLKTFCENGHALDYYLNFAMNVALDCLQKYDIN